ncbi:small acid-soluble spore protein SspI [Paenibacillus thermotolerans]|uniref:small acid-soluble spore protein SspI n=1 Tax=Paenibacillus thermotolerans TaxID=3027807 RepID=UPI0023680F54|nr:MULTISPECIES: small acid-soluble spore protein SspI [unclassified Paenibacillus]
MSMLLDLRQAIYRKIENQTETELYQTIEDSIGNDERALPGIGVLFEVIWRHSDEDTRNKLTSTLREHLPKQTNPKA